MNPLLNAIHPELRTAARLMWRINKTFTRKGLIRMNRMQKIFKPENADHKELPCMIWFHGGGYAIGSPESSDRIAKIFMTVTPCIVVSPDYQLSVQAPYPAALKDAILALTWVEQNAKNLGIDPKRLFVGGESAGGGLSAALCLYARDHGPSPIAFQMPLYPMLDDRMQTPSATNNEAPVWNSDSNFNAWQLYLGDSFGQESVPYYAAPARATDLSGLPPLASFVGDLEPFYDEALNCYKALEATGQKVEYKVFKGCYHAFEQMSPKSQISHEAIDFMREAFSHAAGTGTGSDDE